MRAALLFGPSDLRVVDRATPTPAADEALIRVVRFSPYGTDVGVYLNRGGRYVQSYPVGIGADFGGVVEAVGNEVRNVRAGDRVTALALAHCGRCANCRAGRTNVCLDPAMLNAPRQVCAQEYTCVTANKLAVLPAKVGFENAAMLGGPVVALNALGQLAPPSGATVAVLGGGAMSWGAVATCKAKGFHPVSIGGIGRRGHLAGLVGAIEVFPIGAHDEDASERVRARYPQGFGHIIETTATEWGLKQAIKLSAMSGRIAVTGGGPLPALGWDLVGRELVLSGVRAGPGQGEALAMIAAGVIDLKPTMTHRWPLERCAEAFAALTGPGASEVGRVMIDVTDA